MTIELLHKELHENITDMFSCLLAVRLGEINAHVQEEFDFWFDEEAILYDTDPDSECIDSASADQIDTEHEYLGRFLNKDVVQTYLKSGELVLLVASNETDDGLMTCIAAVDRSTGVALLNTADIFDKHILKEAAAITVANSDAGDNLLPIERHYKLITSKGLNVEQSKIDFSRRRLTALLSDIDVHILSQYLGSPIQSRDDL